MEVERTHLLIILSSYFKFITKEAISVTWNAAIVTVSLSNILLFLWTSHHLFLSPVVKVMFEVHVDPVRYLSGWGKFHIRSYYCRLYEPRIRRITQKYHFWMNPSWEDDFYEMFVSFL